MTATPDPPRGDDAAAPASARLAAIERAYDMVHALCQPRHTQGAREWLMSIPANPERDPDLVIAAGLQAGEEALKDLATAERAATAAHTALAALVAVSEPWLSRPVERGGVICGWYRWCVYCKGGTKGEPTDTTHEPDCPWLQAARWVAATPTPGGN